MDQGGSHSAVRGNALHTGKGPVVHGLAHRQQEAFLQLFFNLFLMRKRRKTCFGGFQAILCLSLW